MFLCPFRRRKGPKGYIKIKKKFFLNCCNLPFEEASKRTNGKRRIIYHHAYPGRKNRRVCLLPRYLWATGFSLIVRMVNSEEDAEELTQDTLMKAFEHLSSFNGKSSFSTWIYRIAYNTALSFLRKKNVEQTVIDDNQWNRISDTQIDDALNNESEEQIEKLQQALTKLTAEERALVTLFYEEEHSIQELAQILNLNEGNIKVKLHRLRKKLYVLMQKED